MEGDNVDISRANGTPVSSRWNPTKEQISMLESLYRQGIRTPSADQIQQITGRLKAFGHIEGKNVFYWFQNHKARQRQKQKQESMAYLNRFLHKPTPPLFPPPPPCANVVCGPYYLPQMDLGYYPQYPKVLLPGGGMRRRLSRTSERVEKSDGGYNLKMHLSDNINDQETLPLFPLHPTGILEGNSSSHHDHALDTAENYSTSAPEITGVEECSNIGQPFFDFFSGQGSIESD